MVENARKPQASPRSNRHREVNKKKNNNPQAARRGPRKKSTAPSQMELIEEPALPAAASEAMIEPELTPASEAKAEIIAAQAVAEPEPALVPAPAPDPKAEATSPLESTPATPISAEPVAEAEPTFEAPPIINLVPSPKRPPLSTRQRFPRPKPVVSKPILPENAEPPKPAATSAPEAAILDAAQDAVPAAPEITGYEFLRVLERTAAGEVWIARRRSARLLAVHVATRTLFASEADFDNAFESVRAYEPLSRAHAGFAGILQSGRTAKCLYYTTSLADDLKTRRALATDSSQPLIDAYSPRTLQSTIAARGPLATQEVLRLGISLAAALQTLHAQGQAYGVVRPERIVFINGEAKLGGPGFASIERRPSANAGDAYIAPEGPGTALADLYSLGQVLHESSKGREDSPANTDEDAGVPWFAQWRRVLAKASAESPARRYQTAQEFQDELAELLSFRIAERKFWTPAKLLALAAMLVAVGAGAIVHILPAKTAASTTARTNPVPSANIDNSPRVAIHEPAVASESGSLATQPASPPEIASSGTSVVAQPPASSPLIPGSQVPPALAPAISGALPPIAAGPTPGSPTAGSLLPNDGKIGVAAAPALAIPNPVASAIAPAMPQEFAALTAPAKAGEPAAPLPAPMQPSKPWTNSLGMKFVPVGDVNFCVWETRVKDYEAFCKATRRFRERALNEETDNHPVVKVSWSEARAFCAWLTQKESAARILPEGYSYRLPTDLEWSAAVGLPQEAGKTPEARDGGVKKTFPWGSSWPPTRGAGNFADTAARREHGDIISGYSDGFARTAPVGSFRSNRAGLFDLAGNVWEWCEDTYSASGTYRVARGGSWADAKPSDLLSSYRNPVAPDTHSLIQGFRCVLAKAAP